MRKQIYYVAGKWEDRLKVRELQEALKQRGHLISLDWTQHEYPTDASVLAQWAELDINGAVSADAIVILMEENHNYKGAWVELGATLATGGNAFIIGHAGDSCIFLHHPQVAVLDSIAAFLRLLDA